METKAGKSQITSTRKCEWTDFFFWNKTSWTWYWTEKQQEEEKIRIKYISIKRNCYNVHFRLPALRVVVIIEEKSIKIEKIQINENGQF